LKLPKNQNAFSYFIKDYPYIYFSFKSFTSSVGTNLINLGELNNVYLEKFKAITIENFNRAFSLIKSVEKNSEINGTFLKENIVNVKIIEHLVSYIRDMSMSYVDLSDEFGDQLTVEDELLATLGDLFSKGLVEHYFKKLFVKIEAVLTSLTNAESEQLNVFKFYFFFFIVYKMNDILITFRNSNIRFLLTDEIQIESVLERFMSQFFNIFLNKIKDIKMLLVNKDISYL
jgi:hypothetical protein